VKWTKSTKFSEVKLYRIPEIPGSPFCPITALGRYYSYLGWNCRTQINPTLPLIMTLNKSRMKPVSTNFLRHKFQELLRRNNMVDTNFTLHSLRRTCAVIIDHEHRNQADLCAHGNWKSKAFLDYVNTLRGTKNSVTKKLVQHYK